jgi:pimeloyl-ACP methyl ester carboxylesterase
MKCRRRSSALNPTVEALLSLTADVTSILKSGGVAGKDALLIGLSVGTFPATYIANNIGARLCSVASADRVDLALWESPAARIVKCRAILKGYDLSDFSTVLAGYHPSENLSGIGHRSMFVFGRRDPFVPSGRANGLLRAIEDRAPRSHIIKLPAGHVGTLIMSARHQRQFADIEPVRTGWSYVLPRCRPGPA